MPAGGCAVGHLQLFFGRRHVRRPSSLEFRLAERSLPAIGGEIVLVYRNDLGAVHSPPGLGDCRERSGYNGRAPA
jgi:hypothetical protein